LCNFFAPEISKKENKIGVSSHRNNRTLLAKAENRRGYTVARGDWMGEQAEKSFSGELFVGNF
jgi:hypothetical protein